MKNRKSFLSVLLVTVAILGATTAAQGAGFKFKFKDVNAPGANETDTYAINNKKQITGDYLDTTGTIHGMILKGKTLTTIDDPNGTGTVGQGINSKGVVVGYYTSSTGTITGFQYSGGTFTDIAPAGALETEASGIDTKGHIVGLYVDSADAQHGFFYNGKTFKNIDVTGAEATVAWGINDAGLITVYSVDTNGDYDSWTTTNKGKTYKKIADKKAGPLGTVVHTPNTNGDIVGTYFDSTPIAHGFLISGGKYYNFNDPKAPAGGPGTRGDGLNDNELIVGRYGAGNGNGGYGFQATATPK